MVYSLLMPLKFKLDTTHLLSTALYKTNKRNELLSLYDALWLAITTLSRQTHTYLSVNKCIKREISWKMTPASWKWTWWVLSAWYSAARDFILRQPRMGDSATYRLKDITVSKATFRLEISSMANLIEPWNENWWKLFELFWRTVQTTLCLLFTIVTEKTEMLNWLQMLVSKIFGRWYFSYQIFYWWTLSPHLL